MTVNFEDQIVIYSEEERARGYIERAWGARTTFTCAIGNTETAKVPGLSAAGAVPQITDFTPAADMELLHYGEVRCMNGIPVTPEGIPTPALITMSSLLLAAMPTFVVNSGMRILPHTPFFDVGGEPGEDIRTGSAVRDPKKVYDRAVTLGEVLARTTEHLVVSESIAGGTTTALAVLMAMGVADDNMVSSSMPVNPKDLKTRVVEEAFVKANIEKGSLSKDPMGAIARVGDPMMPANAGLIVGAARHVPVLLAGGTQMASVLAIVSKMEPSVLDNVAMGTTRWIMNDGTADMARIVAASGKVPLMSTNLNFGESRHEGLRVYERGFVKEGVGCGGSALAAYLASKGKVTCDRLVAEIERNYEKLLSMA